jgi:hypothetical protein
MICDFNGIFILDAEYLDTGKALNDTELDELNLIYEEWLEEENHSFKMMGLYDRSKGE